MTLKTLLAVAALLGTMTFTGLRPADACGMRWEPEPADAMLLAEAAELERSEQTYAALRTYERAMNDHRAVKSVRVEAAMNVGRLRAAAGDVAEANQAYARAMRLGAEAALEAIKGANESGMALSYTEATPSLHILSGN